MSKRDDDFWDAKTSAEVVRCIERAPDMDAALREAVEAMERAQGLIDPHGPGGAHEQLADALARCRAALGEG